MARQEDTYADLNTAPFFYMLERGFSWDTLESWEVGFAGNWSRISIPVRDELSRLVGFKGRAWDGSEPKYMVLPVEGRTYEVSRVVFGMHRAKAHCRRQVVVVEGELNAIAMHQKGWENAVGVSGRFVSADQARVIRHFADSAIVVFDELTDGVEAASTLEPYMPVRVAPPSEFDPADSDRHAIRDRLDAATPSVLLALP
jgi:DNA primase